MTTHGVLSDSELKRAIEQGWIVAPLDLGLQIEERYGAVEE